VIFWVVAGCVECSASVFFFVVVGGWAGALPGLDCVCAVAGRSGCRPLGVGLAWWSCLRWLCTWWLGEVGWVAVGGWAPLAVAGVQQGRAGGCRCGDLGWWLGWVGVRVRCVSTGDVVFDSRWRVGGGGGGFGLGGVLVVGCGVVWVSGWLWPGDRGRSSGGDRTCYLYQRGWLCERGPVWLGRVRCHGQRRLRSKPHVSLDFEVQLRAW